MSVSPVAFELAKRRTRRDFVQFFRDFNTSRTRVWSAVVSNSQATSRNRYVDPKDAKSRPCEDWLFGANRAMCVVPGEEPAT